MNKTPMTELIMTGSVVAALQPSVEQVQCVTKTSAEPVRWKQLLPLSSCDEFSHPQLRITRSLPFTEGEKTRNCVSELLTKEGRNARTLLQTSLKENAFFSYSLRKKNE